MATTDEGMAMVETVTKKDLAYRIAERTGYKKVVVKRVLQEFIDDVIDELARGNRLEFREFGVFEIKTRAARRARNPRTGDRVDVPSKTVIHFKAGRLMKEKVQELKDHDEKNASNGNGASSSAARNGADRGGKTLTHEGQGGTSGGRGDERERESDANASN